MTSVSIFFRRSHVRPYLAAVGLAILLLVGSQGIAQKARTENPTTSWELGLDMMPFFSDRPYGFLIRKASTDNTKALRIRMTPSLLYVDFNTSNIPGWNDVNGSVDIGIEKRQTYGRVQTYYGADLNFIYSYNSSAAGLSISGPGIDDDQLLKLDKSMSREIGGGISALVGARYFINSHISLGAESNLRFAHLWKETFRGKVDLNNVTTDVFFTEKVKLFDIHLVPIVGFYISYHL
jgi:hypothetical protein